VRQFLGRLAPSAGLEPASSVLETGILAARRTGYWSLEPLAGVEPATDRLRIGGSTVELQRLNVAPVVVDSDFTRLLYHAKNL
jgi:hypothetical protein